MLNTLTYFTNMTTVGRRNYLICNIQDGTKTVTTVFQTYRNAPE